MKKSIVKEALIAVYISNFSCRKIIYHNFKKIKEENLLKNARTQYDIPQYIEDMPDGFSIFCTTWEVRNIRKYEKNLKEQKLLKKNNDDKKEIEIEEDMYVVNRNLNSKKLEIKIKISEEFLEPIPKSEHKYCYLCKTIFNDYKFHVNSDKHFENFNKHINVCNRIKNTFERIINFWDIKEGRPIITKIKLITPEKNLIKNEINPSSGLNINKNMKIKDEDISTKEGSGQDNNIKFLYINKDSMNINNKTQQLFYKSDSEKNDGHQKLKINIKSSNIKIDKNIKQESIREKSINNQRNISIINEKEFAILKGPKEDNNTLKYTNGNIVKNIHIKIEKPLFKTNNSCNSSLFKTEIMINKNKINNNIKRKRKRNEYTFFVINTEFSLKIHNNQKQSINGFFNTLKTENPKKVIGKRDIFFK